MAGMKAPRLIRSSSEPTPELGPAMRALHPRWQRAVTALFATNGDRSKALRLAGYKGTPDSMRVMAHRIFADDRVRAGIREEANKYIDVAEPEMIGTTMSILRDVGERAADRLAAVRMIWDRSNPVVSKHKLEVEHHLTNDERDVTHYRALKEIGAPPDAFVARFRAAWYRARRSPHLGRNSKLREIEGDTIDADYELVEELPAVPASRPEVGL